jgi:acetylornithine deacetylase
MYKPVEDPMPDLQIDRRYLTSTLADLIRINSVNPNLVPGAPGEGEIAAYIASQLERLGLGVTIVEPVPGRPSVIGTLAGSGGGRSLMLNGHTDTVGVGGMADPFSAAVRQGKMYGRGAYDMKGSVAACLAAVKALVDARVVLAGDVVIATVADEEFASLGTSEVIKHVKVDAAVVAEPTELEILLAHKGYVWMEVETIGRAAHGSRFDLGIDANLLMGRFLTALAGLEKELRARTPHPLTGPPSMHVGKLHGGIEPSTYASSSKAFIERRTIPGETPAQVTAEVTGLIDRLSREDPNFNAVLTTQLVRHPMEVSAGEPIVQAVAQAAAGLLAAPPPFAGRGYWMDSSLLSAAGIPAVILGPAGAGAHADEEWVDLESVEQVAHILADTAVLFCG